MIGHDGYKTVFTAVMAVLAAFAYGDHRDKDGVQHSPQLGTTRVELIGAVAKGELRCRPTFNSCGVVYGTDGARTLEYRLPGGKWRPVAEFPYFAETGDCRGSVMDLEEDTEYEVRVDGRVTAFRTWKSAVPVARTVEIDPATARFPIVVSDRGSADGWVRYVVRGGTLQNGSSEATMVFKGAAYVLVEGVRFEGGRMRDLVTVGDSECVRIVNCEFSGWGRDYELRYDGMGRPFALGTGRLDVRRNVYGGYGVKGGTCIEGDSAIRIGRGAVGTVVERCWFHDQRIHSNSWYYSHPNGGYAIEMDSPGHSTVIRWCNMTGSDEHPWNDAVGSTENFKENGGFNRDADVYGNFMIFANDDAIELDGGQQNVRCFDNRFESCLCGVSVQGCMAGPSYLWRNGFFGMWEELGSAGQTVKTGGGPHGEEAYVSVSRNLFWGRGTGVSPFKLLNLRLRDNVFCDRQEYVVKPGVEGQTKSTSENDHFGLTLDERLLPEVPVRPLGFTLDRMRFGGLRPGDVVTFRAKSTVATDIPFEIRRNADMPWFEVTPRRGVIRAGGEVAFTLTLDAARMRNRRHYRGAFLVSAPDGLSRCVSLYAETDFVPPFKAEKPGETAVYAYAREDRAPVELSSNAVKRLEFVFTVPKDGRYYFFMHAKPEGFHDPHALAGTRRFYSAFDGARCEPTRYLGYRYPVWAPVWPGNCVGVGLKIGYLDLKAGERHTVTLEPENSAHYIDAMVMTDAPESFEPR